MNNQTIDHTQKNDEIRPLMEYRSEISTTDPDNRGARVPVGEKNEKRNGTARSVILLLLALLSVPFLQPMVNAQQTVPTAGSLATMNVKVARSASGSIDWIDGSLGRLDGYRAQAPIVASVQDNTIVAALGLIEAHKEEFRIQDPAHELVPLRDEVDRMGYRHIRFSQVCQGIPVYDARIDIHVDRDGVVNAVSGTYRPTPVGVSARPSVPEEIAVRRVVEDLTARDEWKPVPTDVAEEMGVEAPESRLVFYPVEEGVRLAYVVDIRPNLMQAFRYVVDAGDGSIIKRDARYCSLVGGETELRTPTVSGMSHPSETQRTMTGSFVDATGVDLNGSKRTFRTYRHGDGLYYAVWDLPNFDPSRSKPPYDLAGGAILYTANYSNFDKDMQIGPVVSADNTWSDRTAVSAHANVRLTYDYYRNTFGRHAIDGEDGRIISLIHAKEGGDALDNAFWVSGSRGRMVYGDGKDLFKPLAGGLDVAAHEMTHGVIEHTAGLEYSGEAGALNESFADVFACFIDRDDYTIGEDIVKDRPGMALRDLSDPGSALVMSRQPDHMLGYDPNGDVHYNSGIPNKAAYFIMSTIGRDKAEQIYYLALQNLQPMSTFVHCRKEVIYAAGELYGQYEAAVAAAAFDAVGIYDWSGVTSGVENDATTTGDAAIASGLSVAPNPARETTMIRFELPESSRVRLEVLDPLGRRVATLLDREMAAGVGTTSFEVTGLPAGTYFLSLRAGATVHTGKLVVVK